MALSRIGASADLANLFARSSYSASSARATALPGRNGGSRRVELHASVVRSYPEAPRIPLPNNVSEIFNTETARFVPERSRDLATPAFLHTWKLDGNSPRTQQFDSRLDSYDCFGAVSLNGAMQTNVPKPFCSTGRSTHLNMPGGIWARDGKYLAEDMRKAHFNVHMMRLVKRYGGLDGSIRGYATSTATDNSNKRFKMTATNAAQPANFSQEDWMKMSKPERLKILIRDYGRTVIVFHIGISLVSLGIFYSLVSSGLDLSSLIDLFDAASKEGSSQLKQKIMNEGSTFLIAYAIHKLFAPVRISTTLICTPVLVKYLRRKGILKAPKVPTAPPAKTSAAR